MPKVGQFVGLADGPAGGLCVINLDDEPWGLVGAGYLFPNDSELPVTIVPLTLDRQSDHGSFSTEMLFADFDGQPLNDQQLANSFPSADVGRMLKGTYKFTKDGFEAQVQSDIGVELNIGTFNPESKKDEFSIIAAEPDVTDWDSFQEKVRSLVPRRYLFRGQSQPWRLRTRFHRTRRSDLIRYWNQDIPALHQNLSHILNNSFNLSDDRHVGAFFSLIQHHGYPTPVLDWTYSAYVAAFFAFQKCPENSDKPVRIWAFDITAWERDEHQLFNVPFSGPHVTRVETLAIENPRIIPQQGVGTLTSVSDLEYYLKNKEVDRNARYIRAFDLPAQQRPIALSELAMMGVTAASLFPGLDGACEALRGRFFGDLNKVRQNTL